MKVHRTGETRPAGGARRSERKREGGGFADHLGEGSATTGPGAAVGPSAKGAVDSILSVQEMPDPTSERSRRMARAHAEDLLDRLEAVRAWILAGAIPKDKLVELAQRLRAQRQRSDDPRLNQIIDEIELRAEVEIAKLTR